MKLSFGSTVLSLFATLTASAFAQECTITAFFVESRLHVSEPISVVELSAIADAVEEIKPTLNAAIETILEKADTAVPSNRNLRANDERQLPCAVCTHMPPPWCFSSGTTADRCRRALTVHEELSEEAVVKLEEGERRRHLQVSSLCLEAKRDIADLIDVALPEGAKYIEQCLYACA
jgi:hypothetical protein